MAQEIIHSSPTAKQSAANNFDIFIIHSVKVFFFLAWFLFLEVTCCITAPSKNKWYISIEKIEERV